MLVAFDIDGTLFDTKKEIIQSMNAVLGRHNIEDIPASEANLFIGPSFHATLPEYRGISASLTEAIVSEFREEYQEIVAFSKPYPDCHALIKLIHQSGFRVCIATNKPMRQVKALLNHSNLYQYFDTIETRELNSQKKEDMLIRIREKFPSEKRYYMVGDTEGDCSAALAVGYEFIEARYGYGEFKHRNKLVADTLSDVWKIVNRRY